MSTSAKIQMMIDEFEATNISTSGAMVYSVSPKLCMINELAEVYNDNIDDLEEEVRSMVCDDWGKKALFYCPLNASEAAYGNGAYSLDTLVLVDPNYEKYVHIVSDNRAALQSLELQQTLGAIAFAAAFRVMYALLHRRKMLVETTIERHKKPKKKHHNLNYTTISLSAPQYIHSINKYIVSGGWRMPLHEVRGHYRRLSDGRTVFVRPHQRGSEEVQRKTITRIIP